MPEHAMILICLFYVEYINVLTIFNISKRCLFTMKGHLDLYRLRYCHKYRHSYPSQILPSALITLTTILDTLDWGMYIDLLVYSLSLVTPVSSREGYGSSLAHNDPEGSFLCDYHPLLLP